jgi:hypothetical protein
MGQGSYCICELDSVQKDNPRFQAAFKQLEADLVMKCNTNWAPKSCGYLKPDAGQYGRVPILPALFDDHSNVQMVTWRQGFTTAGHQTLMTGTRAGNTIPEDFKVGLIGIAFPNKQQHISEIKMQIGDRKFGRINLEEMHQYNKPAIIFEEGSVIDEETAFDLYGYVEGPIPAQAPFINTIYQRIVLIGAAYYKYIDKVLGNCGAAI